MVKKSVNQVIRQMENANRRVCERAGGHYTEGALESHCQLSKGGVVVLIRNKKTCPIPRCQRQTPWSRK